MQRSALQLVASICLLAVWIATPLLAAAHLALEEHSYCAEHERLEERGHGEPRDESETVASDTIGVSPAIPGETEAEHEECAFGEDFTRECIACERANLTDAPPPAVASLASLPESLIVTTTILLHLAPKNSPPVAS